MRNILVILFFCLSLLNSRAQVPSLPSCQNCLDSVVHAFWTNPPDFERTGAEEVELNFELYLNSDKEGLLFVGSPDVFEFEINNGGIIKDYYGGKGQAKNKLLDAYARYCLPVKLDSGLNHFHFKAHSVTNLPFHFKPVFIENELMSVAKVKFKENAAVGTTFMWLVPALILVFLILSLINYLVFRNTFFKTYIVYVAVVLVLMLIWIDLNGQFHLLFPERPKKYWLLMVFVQQWSYFVYTSFFIRFLDLKNTDPHARKVLHVFQGMTVVLSFLFPLYAYFNDDFLFIFERLKYLNFIAVSLSTYAVIRVGFTVKNNLKYYLISGSFVVSFFNMTEMYWMRETNGVFGRDFFGPTYAGLSGFNFSQIGYLLELFIFYLGLSHKGLYVERERAALKTKTIEQLEENNRLEEKVMALLKVQLKKSEEALESQQLKSKAESDLLKANLRSIQLQMNPHYFFNSLNAINDFIFDKKPRQASEYLAKYAQLMRSVLRNSEKLEITIQKEIEHIRVYLELEKMRFENSFDFEILKDIELLEQDIPLMLIQPLLENAVWHGFKDIDYQGKLWVRFIKTSTGFRIEIEDNGKGVTPKVNKRLQESKGLKMLEEKLAVSNRMFKHHISFELINKPSENHGVLGVFSFDSTVK